MQKVYEIKGMTCKSCEAVVAKILKNVDGVMEADVVLEKKKAMLKMKRPITINDLRQVLPAKYQILEKNEIDILASDRLESTPKVAKSKLQQLKPLFLIFFYLISASILLHIKKWNTMEVMLDFMGLFYLVFSFFKLLDLKGFPTSFSMYDPLAKRVPIYGWIYPFIEVGLGLMLLFRFEIFYAIAATLVILGTTTIGVTSTLINKKKIRCACLGTALKLPMTQATLIENSIMIIMAIFMLLKIAKPF